MPRKRQNIGIHVDIMPTGAGFDSSTYAWVNRVVFNGGTVSFARQGLVDTMIRGLKSDGVWSKLDRLWILAAENTPSALTDMVALTLAVAHGSPAFTTDRGYTGIDASTTVYIDTGVNLSTFGGLFGTNAGHISAWSNTNAVSTGTGGVIIGVSQDGTANDTNILPQFFDGNTYFRCNDLTNTFSMVTSTATGHYLANRSGAALTQGYVNGGLLDTPNAAAGTLQNVNIVILANNDATSGIGFGGGYQIPMASIGGNQSATDVSNFYTRLRTYMSAVGVP